MGEQKYNFPEGQVLWSFRMTAVSGTRAQRPVYICNSFPGLTSVLSCPHKSVTHIHCNQHNELLSCDDVSEQIRDTVL